MRAYHLVLAISSKRKNRDVIATEELDPILALTRDAAAEAISSSSLARQAQSSVQARTGPAVSLSAPLCASF
jgi:hypothetical protein